MQKRIKAKEFKKIAKMVGYPKPNLPTPAVLVVCCLIDTLARNYKAKDRCGRFAKFIDKKMRNTSLQLKKNDSTKKRQIKNINCNFKGHDKNKKCKTSVEILYRHVRCGLVHNYFDSPKGFFVINRPNKKQEKIIIDQSKKYAQYTLVLNGSGFVKDFLISLSK